MNIEQLAADVIVLMKDAPPATVVRVYDNGQVVPQLPGVGEFAGIDRRRQAIATFVASRVPPPYEEVLDRIAQGLRKRQLAG